MNETYDNIRRLAQAMDTKRKTDRSRYNRVTTVDSVMRGNEVLEVIIDFDANVYQSGQLAMKQALNDPSLQHHITQRCVATAREFAKNYLAELAQNANVKFRSVSGAERFWTGPNESVYGYMTRKFSYRAMYHIDYSGV